MALLPWRKGIVTKIEDHTPTTRRFWIQVPELERFDFKPGQFVTLDLPIHEKINKRLRSYSIASWPDGTNEFELLIVRAKDGVGTAYLFDEIKTGSEITFRGAQGVFTLPEQTDKKIILICTGTGLAPFRSMVQLACRTHAPAPELHIVFGCRTREELLYYEELKALEANCSLFHFHPVLSREQWDGPTGYVHPIYESICASHPPALFYLCGWKNMIDEAKQRILALGYDKKDIHQELYG